MKPGRIPAAAFLGLALAAASAWAGGLPASHPAAPPAPEYFLQLDGYTAGAGRLAVNGRVQYAVAESLDLVRVAPALVRLPRLEATVGPEELVLHARRATPEIFRSAVPRHKPLLWRYEMALPSPGPGPWAMGADYACLWLGPWLLAPRLPQEEGGGEAAVWTILLGGWLPGEVHGPWPRRSGFFRPADLDAAIDAFLAWGTWRAQVQAVAACSLEVALAGALPVEDAALASWLARTLAPDLPPDGRALACVAPGGETLRAYRARRSFLVLWPPGQRALPAQLDSWLDPRAAAP